MASSWLNRLDKRTKVARAVLNRITELEADAGGAESWPNGYCIGPDVLAVGTVSMFR